MSLSQGQPHPALQPPPLRFNHGRQIVHHVQRVAAQRLAEFQHQGALAIEPDLLLGTLANLSECGDVAQGQFAAPLAGDDHQSLQLAQRAALVGKPQQDIAVASLQRAQRHVDALARHPVSQIARAERP